MKKYKNTAKLAAIVVLAAAITGCSSSSLALTADMETDLIGEGSGSGSLVSKGKESFDADEFESVEVTATAMEIFVTESSAEQAEVELLTDEDIGNRFTFEADIRDGVLEAQVEEESKSFNFNPDGQKGERKLLISLPEKQYKKLKIRNAFGRVEASGVEADQVEIKLDAGAIRLDGVAGELDLEAAAGEIEVGGIRLDHHVTAKTDAGEIKIHLLEAPKDAEFLLQSDVGEVTANLGDADYKVNASNEKAGTIGSGGVLLEASTGVGAISVDAK
ncbi:DUF4097 domain-containing protein [Paenibacillus sp. N4]|uniref:DUF4097 family beta strand repeat-containing protein n=1 Tax=Paenibacillus vietnamensis TaxID=2590547 RepID=UPI001CD04EFE|nr:DUF4097 family beta strand repeat-containing protein [Paenibacillus vietnamensis]MCA0757912.1 DUF4097 domain-containing protein [Paenibacillus vietnamensis]